MVRLEVDKNQQTRHINFVLYENETDELLFINLLNFNTVIKKEKRLTKY